MSGHAFGSRMKVASRMCLSLSLTIRQHDGEVENVLFHGSVSDSVRATAVCGRHASERCARARVDRVEQAVLLQFGVQVVPAQTGVHHAIHVTHVQRAEGLHLREIDVHAAQRSRGVAYQTSKQH